MDIVGDLPVILMEIDPEDNNSIEKTYIYANGQVLAQHDGDYTDDIYFYLHDRLGSVRQVIAPNGDVKNRYTYQPFGLVHSAETEEDVNNPFGFTGQWFDDEIDQYYLRARMYDPHIGRFTSRDPVKGKFKEPMTLHKYLYCINDPVNSADPTGELSLGLVGGSAMQSAALNAMLSATRGGSARDIVISGLAGGFGSLLSGGVSAWLGNAGAFGTLLGPYTKLAYDAVGGLAGGMAATTLGHFGQEGDQKVDARFLADLFASGTFGAVFGGLNDPHQSGIADLYDDVVGFFAYWLWDEYADKTIYPDQEDYYE